MHHSDCSQITNFVYHINKPTIIIVDSGIQSGVFTTLPDTETNKETDKKSVVLNCVARCSYWSETDTNADSHWVLC